MPWGQHTSHTFLASSSHAPACGLVPFPVSRLTSSAAVAAAAAGTLLARCYRLTHSCQVLTAHVVADHRQWCFCCQHIAQFNSSTILLRNPLESSRSADEMLPQCAQVNRLTQQIPAAGLICGHCCCPAWAGLLQLQQVAPLHLLAAGVYRSAVAAAAAYDAFASCRPQR
jgi:hypothetical protein